MNYKFPEHYHIVMRVRRLGRSEDSYETYKDIANGEIFIEVQDM